MTNVSIHLNRLRKVYHQGEHLTGRIVIDNKSVLRHDGVFVSLDGLVEVSTNSKSVSLFDAISNQNKSIKLVDFTHQLLEPGRLQVGQTVLPFKILLDASVDVETLYETYHGVFISIQYFIKCHIKRPIFCKDIVEALEFVVEYESQPIGALANYSDNHNDNDNDDHEWLLQRKPIEFCITPDNLSGTTNAAACHEPIPNFKIVGHLDALVWRLQEPLTGQFVIEFCDAPIRSVELQLVRVETSGEHLSMHVGVTNDDELVVQAAEETTSFQQLLATSGRSSSSSSSITSPPARPPPPPQLSSSSYDKVCCREATEVQNIQIGDGNLLRNMPLAIHMILPRLFTCPTLITNTFKIGE